MCSRPIWNPNVAKASKNVATMGMTDDARIFAFSDHTIVRAALLHTLVVHVVRPTLESLKTLVSKGFRARLLNTH